MQTFCDLFAIFLVAIGYTAALSGGLLGGGILITVALLLIFAPTVYMDWAKLRR